VTLVGEMFPADPVVIGGLLEPLGLAAGPAVPTREWRELYSALDCAAVAAIHPFYTASFREFEAAGRPIVGSAPVGHDGTAAWLDAIGTACGVPGHDRGREGEASAPIKAALARAPIQGRITLSGYEGSELLVARLLVESGADVPYVGTACPRTRFSEPDRAWLEARGVAVQYRPRSSRTSQRWSGTGPTSRSARLRSCRRRRPQGIPALYFTNLISARPLFGAAGAGSLAQVVNAALGSRSRFDEMTAFFEGVGIGDTAGIHQDTPKLRPEFREYTRKALQRLAKQRASEAMI
jgi:chlorophyllide a reductase subunit Y